MPDGKILVNLFLGMKGDSIDIFDPAKVEVTGSVVGSSNTYLGMALSPDTLNLAVTQLHVLSIIEIGSGKNILTVTASMIQQSIWESVAYSPNGRFIGFESADPEKSTGLSLLWNIPENRLEYQFAGHADYITDMAFSPDGGTLASSSDDGTIILWNIGTL